MIKRAVFIVALLGLALSLWPTTASLADLTGEQARLAQLRGLLHWFNTALRPQPQLAATAAVSQLHDLPPYGVNTFLQQEVELAKRERSMQLIKEAGFAFIRQEFPWEDIEIHAKGDFLDRRNEASIGIVDAWEKYDHIVSLAAQYDVQIIARLSNPPSWSRSQPDAVIGAHAPPDDFADYADFVTAVATRYRGRIRYYQLWNEPNIFPEWGQQEPHPEQFTALLCAGYEAVKTADPDAIVLAGALSPTVDMRGFNMNDLIFLQRMYNAGAADCFDIFSAQGYGLWSGPTDQRLRPTVINYPHNLLLRDVMVRNGDAAKPIWISEMGWNAVPDGIPPNFGQVTEALQAAYGVDGFRVAQMDWPWVGVVNYWFFKRPADVERDQAWYYFRLLEPDFTPLPVFTAVSDYMTAAETVTPAPAWIRTWQQMRPPLFLASAAILFFGLLWFFHPEAKAS